jgi:hypothetical protein
LIGNEPTFGVGLEHKSCQENRAGACWRFPVLVARLLVISARVIREHEPESHEIVQVKMLDRRVGRRSNVRACATCANVALSAPPPRRPRARLMTPMEFMARLAALIPRPKIPLVRYHGVFASRSSWRPLVTPKPPPKAKPKPKPCAAALSASTPAAISSAPARESPTAESPATESLAVASSLAAAPAPALAPAPTLALAVHAVAAVPAEPVVLVDPAMITVEHWRRRDDGELFAGARYVAWAVLRKRTFGFEVLRCPTCSRKIRVISTITEPAVAPEILEPLGVRASPLPRAPARAPEWDQVSLGFESA